MLIVLDVSGLDAYLAQALDHLTIPQDVLGQKRHKEAARISMNLRPIAHEELGKTEPAVQTVSVDALTLDPG